MYQRWVIANANGARRIAMGMSVNKLRRAG